MAKLSVECHILRGAESVSFTTDSLEVTKAIKGGAVANIRVKAGGQTWSARDNYAGLFDYLKSITVKGNGKPKDTVKTGAVPNAK